MDFADDPTRIVTYSPELFADIWPELQPRDHEPVQAEPLDLSEFAEGRATAEYPAMEE